MIEIRLEAVGDKDQTFPYNNVDKLRFYLQNNSVSYLFSSTQENGVCPREATVPSPMVVPNHSMIIPSEHILPLSKI